MSELIRVSDALFKNKSKWNSLSDSDKETSFFIFNRYFSKTYPEKSYLLNSKSIDRKSAMDVWFHFMKNEKYPYNFWRKSTNVKEKDKSKKISNSDFSLLMRKLKLDKEEDLNYLIENYIDLILEELKFFKKDV